MSKKKQIHGPFSANIELLDNYSNIIKIGIISEEGHMITINSMPFEIGKTGILEIEGTNIESLSFQQAESEKTIVDFIEK